MSTAHEEMVEAGRVGRAHGLDGSFHVTRPDARLLRGSQTLTLAGRALKVERYAGTDERPIVRLEGVSSREDAQALRGQALRVALEQLPTLGDGEFWAHELVGCAVYGDGRALGRVSGLLVLPSCEALQVETNEGGEMLIPMVKDAILEVDVRGQRIDVDLGFLGEP
jgi:16S rRNA processing protein RimM